MPTKSRCFTPVRGRAMRVTKVDGCGRPVYGDNTSVVSDGFVTASFSANTDDGEEINVTNAAGKRCVYEPACPTLLGYDLEVEFCRVDPYLFALMTNQTVILDPESGDAIGFKICTDVDNCAEGFALEIWTGAPASSSACEDSDQGAEAQAGGYLLVPYLQGGTFGDFTIENDAVTFTVTGASTKDGSLWGDGPHPVEWDPTTEAYGPLRSTTVTSCDHLVVMQTTTPPPTPYCGPVPTLDPDGAPVTGIVVGAGADELSVTFAPNPAGADPFWVDFGDGEWDYSEDGTTLEHTYATAGTYTVVIYRGATMFFQDVTVPLSTSS